MSKNTKQTSEKLGQLASKTLQDRGASKIAKSLAASALSQRNGDKQTSAEIESKASGALDNKHSAKVTKELAASVLSQANKER